MARQYSIANLRHPYYTEKFLDWQKWRFTYDGGQRFIDRFLVKFSAREGDLDFKKRKSLSYNPAFAKAAVDEVKNSIFQRLIDVIRAGGPDSYKTAIAGDDGGVDLMGSSMNSFIGRKILPELLTMSRVGVFVDMPKISGITLADAREAQPYMYVYRAEDICSWTLDDTNNENEYTNILLRDYIYSYDDATGLPTGLISRYRRMWVDQGVVRVKFFSEGGNETDINGNEAEDHEIVLDIPRIPFALAQLSDSLLTETANYQIALLNLASSDLLYALQSNYPFYTEQFDSRADSVFTRRPGPGTGGEAADGEAAKTETVKIGASAGRRYPIGMERPGFIHPSSEPLKASMEKQNQLKQEIRQLVALAISNLQPTVASAESKQADQSSLEDGLSYIGLELEQLERKVSDFWAMYLKATPANVFYPENWTIKTADERRKEAEQLGSTMNSIPSSTYQKEAAKEIARLTLGRRVTGSVYDKISSEIDKAPGAVSDPLIIQNDIAAGILDLETAAALRGYPKDTVEKAADDHADRLARISDAQSKNAGGGENPAARGVQDLDGNPTGGAKQEKAGVKDTTTDKTVEVDKTRGKGANNNTPA